jgi:hypothetical protein
MDFLVLGAEFSDDRLDVPCGDVQLVAQTDQREPGGAYFRLATGCSNDYKR